MRIDTKLDVGNECFYLNENKVVQSIVAFIEIRIRSDKVSFRYVTNNNDSLLQEHIWNTKQELLESL